mmetsp:Transcript_118654/g.335593  ORF Transcript_118654/g.335593 Transcript_118654/m.335593 type:complete len:233 (-) Transcript_118654:1189-1887(-)
MQRDTMRHAAGPRQAERGFHPIGTWLCLLRVEIGDDLVRNQHCNAMIARHPLQHSGHSKESLGPFSGVRSVRSKERRDRVNNDEQNPPAFEQLWERRANCSVQFVRFPHMLQKHRAQDRLSHDRGVHTCRPSKAPAGDVQQPFHRHVLCVEEVHAWGPNAACRVRVTSGRRPQRRGGALDAELRLPRRWLAAYLEDASPVWGSRSMQQLSEAWGEGAPTLLAQEFFERTREW